MRQPVLCRWIKVGLIAVLVPITNGPSDLFSQSRFRINPFFELMRFDEEGKDPLSFEPVRANIEIVWGVRSAFEVNPRWFIEAEMAFSDMEPVVEATDPRLAGQTAPFGVDLFALSLNIARRISIAHRVELVFSGGVGALRLALEKQGFQAPCFQETIFDCDVSIDLEGSETDGFLNFAAGVVVPVEQRLRLRLEVRDRIQFCHHTTPPFGVPEIIVFTCGESEGAKLHHVAGSFGLEVAL